jgi:toxin ParE1/3/4
MSFQISIHSTAMRDINEYADYISQNSIDAALRFYESVSETTRMIAEHPARWPRYEPADPRAGEIRRRAVIGFDKYLIFYRIGDDAVEILRVMHGSRDIHSILANESRDE